MRWKGKREWGEEGERIKETEREVTEGHGDREREGESHLIIATITYLFDCEKERAFRRLCSCLVLNI